MKKWMTLMVFLCSAAVLPLLQAKEVRPNILIIMCDDLGYADVSFNGAPDIRTPEIDSLAEAGTICTSGYVSHPFCGPSRMGLLSGRYPHAYGGQFNLPPMHSGIEEYIHLGMPESETLIGTILQNAGYFTGAIGKWHLGEEPQYHPNNRGFDDFYGFLGGGHSYLPEKYTAACERQKAAGNKIINGSVAPLEHNGVPVEPKGYLTDELSGQAVWFLDEAAEKKNKPFFLYLAYNAPHSPMEATKADLALYSNIADEKRRTVAGMMAAVDRGVGRVIDALKKNDQFDNTLIIFLSDNGGKPVFGSSNKPLRGHKGDSWEGGFRVPMFWCWPGTIPVQKYDFPVSSLDFYPTFAALAGAEIPEDKVLDGRNVLADLIHGTDARHGGYIFSFRQRMNYTDISARRGDWKVTRFGDQPWRLFNITNDPGETQDLSAENPERVGEMVKAAEVWSHGVADPHWFHSETARDGWIENGLTDFSGNFEPVIGASELPPVTYITDEPSVNASEKTFASVIKLRKSDLNLERFLAERKELAQANGVPFDSGSAEKLFRRMDDDKNDIVTAIEQKSFINQN